MPRYHITSGPRTAPTRCLHNKKRLFSPPRAEKPFPLHSYFFLLKRLKSRFTGFRSFSCVSRFANNSRFPAKGPPAGKHPPSGLSGLPFLTVQPFHTSLGNQPNPTGLLVFPIPETGRVTLLARTGLVNGDGFQPPPFRRFSYCHYAIDHEIPFFLP